MLDPRPPKMDHIRTTRDWQGAANGAGAPVPATSSAFLSKRRSAAVNVPPPGPPPSQPIPHLPGPHSYEAYDDAEYGHRPYDQDSSDSHSHHPYTRPSASANLAAVAAFSQHRHAEYASSAASSVDNLSDSPPRSMLRAGARSPVTSDIVPDRLLLSPPEPRSAEPRPSSRRALTKALELAREAVKLDSTNDDPYGAVLAYGKSVALLSEVMERVMRGEDSTETRRKNGRRRSVVAQEEEVRRLKSIVSAVQSCSLCSVISRSNPSSVARYVCGSNEHPKLDIQHTATNKFTAFNVCIIISFCLDRVDDTLISYVDITYLGIFTFFSVHESLLQ